MSKKTLKYIMELIFIFILPFILIAVNITIENNYVYDNNGNFETSEKTLTYTGINYLTRTETTTTTEMTFHNNLSDYSFSSFTGDLYFDYEEGFTLVSATYYNCIEDGKNYNIITLNADTIVFQSDDYGTSTFSFDIVNIDNENYYHITATNLTFELGDSYIFYNGYYTATTTTETITENSPLVDLKNIICNVILVSSTDTIFNIVFDYTCLWFIMFIIWHLVYLFIDFLLHFWKKEDR